MENLHTFVVLAYKESQYLEECILSVLHQAYKSKVIIATSTPNDYISDLANKYSLDIKVNPTPGKGIGYDFDYALSTASTKLATVAHQDDIYDYDYSLNMVNEYMKHTNALIIFPDYYEIRDNQIVRTNLNLKIKRLLLIPQRIGIGKSTKFIKRSAIAFGNAISCPSVCFVKPNIPFEDYFACNLLCDIDWYAWERLSRQKGSFVFINKQLMGHRIHSDSTTTEIIGESLRTKEDLILLRKFWPLTIAKLINSAYKKSEESNKI